MLIEPRSHENWKLAVDCRTIAIIYILSCLAASTLICVGRKRAPEERDGEDKGNSARETEGDLGVVPVQPCSNFRSLSALILVLANSAADVDFCWFGEKEKIGSIELGEWFQRAHDWFSLLHGIVRRACRRLLVILSSMWWMEAHATIRESLQILKATFNSGCSIFFWSIFWSNCKYS